MSKKSSRFRELIKYRAGALCLIGILSATYLHSMTFMSQFFYHSLILGGVAAFAIDAGVVAMSIFKDELLKDGELAWMVRIVTCIVLFASGVANMAEGFKSAYGANLTVDSLMALDPLSWTQWLAGTIVFPIMAYVMCDTIGTRNLVQFKQQQSRSEAGSRQVQPSRSTVATGSLEVANEQKKKNKQQKMEEFVRVQDQHPDWSLRDIASDMTSRGFKVSAPTLVNYKHELEQFAA